MKRETGSLFACLTGAALSHSAARVFHQDRSWRGVIPLRPVGGILRGGALAALVAILLCAGGICLAQGSPAGAETAQYTVVDVVSPITPILSVSSDPYYTEGFSLNAKGQVAGGFLEPNRPSPMPFVWDPAGGLTLLQLALDWPSDATYPLGINDFGITVGRELVPQVRPSSPFQDSNYRAGIWSPAGSLSVLTPVYYNADQDYALQAAFGINNLGTAVGFANRFGGDTAMMWLPDGTTREIGKMRVARYSNGWETGAAYARRINDLGQVVGWGHYPLLGQGDYGGPEASYAFIWTADGSFQDLGSLDPQVWTDPISGAAYHYANVIVPADLNNNGQVVGWSRLGNSVDRPFIWDSALGIRALPLLYESPYSNISAFALGINNQGDVVGTSLGADTQWAAVLWRNGVVTDLNTALGVGSGWRLSAAHDINDSGDILCSAIGPDNARHLVLLRPVRPPNRPPVANAGSNQTVSVPHDGNPATSTATVTLDGSASSDPDGDALVYRWDDGYGHTYLTASPTVSYPAGSYVATLTVTDTFGATNTKSVVIIVAAEPNQAPVAAAGDDQAVTVPLGAATASFSLDGTTSSDPDGDSLTYQWSLGGSVVGTTATLTQSQPPGTYTYTLKVTDPYGASSTDDVTVVVRPAPHIATFLTVTTGNMKRGVTTTMTLHLDTADGPLVGKGVKIYIDGSLAGEVISAKPAKFDYTPPASMALGSHTVTARFDGDTDYQPSENSKSFKVIQ